MADAHHRKKQPELVRIHLIESARKLARENGLAALSLEDVAADAGVTKGGLLHHFPNKRALVDAVFQHLLHEFETDLDRRMEKDREPYGRFTRAYVASVFEVGADAQWGALWIATLTDPQLRQLWGGWLSAQISRHGETDLRLESARFAADGIWLGHLFGVAPSNLRAFRRHLFKLITSEK